MAFASVTCPACGTDNPNYMVKCTKCGADLPKAVREARAGRGSTTPAAVAMGLLVIAALFLLVAGFIAPGETAIQQAAIFAAAAVCGILARLCQASVHHARVLEELRRQ